MDVMDLINDINLGKDLPKEIVINGQHFYLSNTCEGLNSVYMTKDNKGWMENNISLIDIVERGFEPEIGEYCRDSYGKIGRCLEQFSTYEDGTTTDDAIEVEPVYIGKSFKMRREMLKSKIVNKNKKLIALVKIGDIVNGNAVTEVCGNYIKTGNRVIFDDDISSILTKELYDCNKYKREE